jgi:hypothetical protein
MDALQVRVLPHKVREVERSGFAPSNGTQKKYTGAADVRINGLINRESSKPALSPTIAILAKG